VRDGAVHLINESRGRVAQRQRWPDGLHAAVEAKEGLAASESGEAYSRLSEEGYSAGAHDLIMWIPHLISCEIHMKGKLSGITPLPARRCRFPGRARPPRSPRPTYANQRH
jgi:SecA preprotein cross-linking domain